MNRWIAAGAAGYAGIGLAALARPSMVPALFGGAAENASARTEIRAVYGGLPLAIAATLAASATSALPMAALSAGMAAGRGASMLFESEAPTPMNKVFLGVEAALTGVLVVGGVTASRRRG